LDSNKYNVGEIILIDFPYSNLKGSKFRPAIIVGKTDFQDDLIVAYVTTEIESYVWSEYAVKISQKHLQSGIIKQDSLIRCDKVITINPQRVGIRKVASLKKTKIAEVIRKVALISVIGAMTTIHEKQPFIPGKLRVNYAGRVFDSKEINNAVEASLDFWLTEGKFSEEFSGKIAEFIDVENVLLTNSGSSANLLAFSALTSEKLGEKRLKPGDEVISVAAGFPATVTPITTTSMWR